MELLGCTKCKRHKPDTAKYFPPNSRKRNGLDSWCRECRSEYRKRTRIPPGIVDRDRAMQARGIAECIICGERQALQLSVDHDHKTGLVRGALCTRCNLGLGHFRDSPKLLRFAALYLEGRCACGKCKPQWGGIAKKTANDPDSRINKSLRAWNC